MTDFSSGAITPPPAPAPIIPQQHPLRITLLIASIVLALIVAGICAWHWYSSDAAPEATVNEAFNEGELDAAIAAADRLLAEDPNNVSALVSKSFALSQKGTTEFKESEYGPQAAVVAEQAIAIHASSSEAYRALAYAHEIQQKYPEAHTAYVKSIQLNPKNALAVFGDAHVYDLQGDVAKAEAGYRAAIAISPQIYPAYLGLGRVENAKGNPDAAIEAFTKVYSYSQNKHDKAQAAFSIGMLHLTKGTENDVNLARGYFQKATEFDPSYPGGWTGQGIVLYTQALMKEASETNNRLTLLIGSIEALNKAIDLNPAQSIAHLQLAQTFYVIGQLEFAASSLDNAEQAVPRDITLNAPEKAGTLKRIAEVRVFIENAN